MTLKNYNLLQSVGRTGICYDNSMAESFFAALKDERVHRTQYPTRKQAREMLQGTSNSATIGYVSIRRSATGPPQEVHDEYLERQFAA